MRLMGVGLWWKLFALGSMQPQSIWEGIPPASCRETTSHTDAWQDRSQHIKF